MSERLNVGKNAGTAVKLLIDVGTFVAKSPLPASTKELVQIRVSQINGCGFCLDMHVRDAKKAGETDQRLATVAGWRDTPYFTDAERAALGLAEAATRITDSAGVPDDVWDEAAEHYDDETLAALVVVIATINAWNRINVTTRHEAGAPVSLG